MIISAIFYLYKGNIICKFNLLENITKMHKFKKK
jgi:hypothetical protein